jgi:hypothetical protein
VVYVYDRDDVAILAGEIDAKGTATLDPVKGNGLDVDVEVHLDDDLVSGTVTLPAVEPGAFTAAAATGTAGVYQARGGTSERSDVSADWVVLPEGCQRGCVCAPYWPSHGSQPWGLFRRQEPREGCRRSVWSMAEVGTDPLRR